MDPRNKYWFPAKKYGWGWGLPNNWAGWFVIIAYFASLALLIYYCPPEVEQDSFLIGVAVSTAILLAICWLKG